MVMIGCKFCGSWDSCDCAATQPLRAEIQKLKDEIAVLRKQLAKKGQTAARQREACARFLAATMEQASDLERDDIDMLDVVRATPLVQ